jgi:hypothetical protein
MLAKKKKERKENSAHIQTQKRIKLENVSVILIVTFLDGKASRITGGQ